MADTYFLKNIKIFYEKLQFSLQDSDASYNSKMTEKSSSSQSRYNQSHSKLPRCSCKKVFLTAAFVATIASFFYLRYLQCPITCSLTTHLMAENCVHPDLRYLTTNYTAKLCKKTYWNPPTNSESQDIVCQYQHLNPFDPVVAKYQGESVKKYTCEILPEYVNLTFIFTTDFESTLVTLIPPSKLGLEDCYYKTLSMPTSFKDGENLIASEEYTLIKENSARQQIPPEYEFIEVYCTEAVNNTNTQNHSNHNDEHQQPQEEPVKAANEKLIDMFAFVPLKPSVESRIKESKQTEESSLNIAILGLDSISHMNFIRTMPKSYEYIVEDLQALGLNGYNAIEENTFGNIIAVLTGLGSHQLEKAYPKCPAKTGPYDECPFIWKEFASFGYRTALVEDNAWLSMYHYSRAGFRAPPTDYYIRPFMTNSDSFYHWNKPKENRTSDFPCYAGRRLYMQYILDYMKRMAITMATGKGMDRRYFELAWTSTLSHSFLNWPFKGDEPLLETLKWFKSSGYLNNTVFILMSDHGMRYGPMRSTFQGHMEAFLPFIFFVFPQWFREKYSAAIENLKENKYRLSSPYDVYHTLMDLLHLENLNEVNIRKRSARIEQDVEKKVRNKLNDVDKRHGISLFLPIPKTRTCSDAGISDLYCTCHQLKPISDFKTDPIVKEMALVLVSEINNLTKSYPLCAKLQLGTILKAEQIVTYGHGGIMDEKINKQIKTKDESGNKTRQPEKEVANVKKERSISVETKPGGGNFEARFIYDVKTKKSTLKSNIIRTNLYGNQSHCISAYDLKVFCFCKDQG